MDLPQPPADQDLRNIIDKLAQFVARNGPEFEHMTKTKQKDNPKFSFLFGGEFYHYYTYKVNAEQAILRQKGGQSSMGPMPNSGGQGGYYNQPPPNMGGWRGPPPGGAPPFRGPPPLHTGPPSHRQQEGWNQGPHPGPANVPGGSGRPRSLMDIPTYAPSNNDNNREDPTVIPPPNPNLTSSSSTSQNKLDPDRLEEEIVEAEKKISTLQAQITQSEQNLSAQDKVTEEQIKTVTEETMRKAEKEHLDLLSNDTDVPLDDFEEVLQPIIESCTKDTISGGKVWIFNNANSRVTCRLIAQYLAHKVTDPSASFQIKLHIIYLMNDVLHHCMRKNNDDLRCNLETVSAEMFCSAWISSSNENENSTARQAKLTKLIKLWQDKSIFDPSTLTKMQHVEETWEECKNKKLDEYQQQISLATKHLKDTYQNYSNQHHAFVTHAETTIEGLISKISELQEEITKVNTAPPPPPVVPSSQPTKKSRWDTGSDGQSIPHHAPDFPMPPSTLLLPDLSRPPPGFGGPPPHMPPQQGRPAPFNDSNLIPTLPYHDLPAGLMVPLIKMEDSGYKPVDPKKLRLPPPAPPTERLLAALEQFYAPPSHERPRDPEGWEMLGLYEWSRKKTAAIKKKADDIEAGIRDRSPTASPEPFDDDDHDVHDQQPEQSEQQRPRKRYRSKSRSRSRTRSRTRSRSRESTPDQSRGGPGGGGSRARRSPSPDGSYTLPSYLTKRSPSPEQREPSPPPRGGGGSGASSTRDRGRRSQRRSPTPPETAFKGFGGNTQTPAQQLDSSNKGHQMMQKMGWKGSGLGTTEAGIVEPISGGEVRDRESQYRGIGHSTSADPFEAFRKSKAGSFYTRMKERDRGRDEARKSKRSERGGDT